MKRKNNFFFEIFDLDLDLKIKKFYDLITILKKIENTCKCKNSIEKFIYPFKSNFESMSTFIFTYLNSWYTKCKYNIKNIRDLYCINKSNEIEYMINGMFVFFNIVKDKSPNELYIIV